MFWMYCTWPIVYYANHRAKFKQLVISAYQQVNDCIVWSALALYFVLSPSLPIIHTPFSLCVYVSPLMYNYLNLISLFSHPSLLRSYLHVYVHTDSEASSSKTRYWWWVHWFYWDAPPTAPWPYLRCKASHDTGRWDSRISNFCIPDWCLVSQRSSRETPATGVQKERSLPVSYRQDPSTDDCESCVSVVLFLIFT